MTKETMNETKQKGAKMTESEKNTLRNVLEILAESFGNPTRVVLNREFKGTLLYRTIAGNALAIHESKKGVANLQEELVKLRGLDEEGKAKLTHEDSLDYCARYATLQASKTVAKSFIKALHEEGHKVLTEVSSEDYEGCPCVLCSIYENLSDEEKEVAK